MIAGCRRVKEVLPGIHGREGLVKGDAHGAHIVDESLPVVGHDDAGPDEVGPGFHKKLPGQGLGLLQQKGAVSPAEGIILRQCQGHGLLVDVGAVFVLAFQGDMPRRAVVDAHPVFFAHLHPRHLLAVGRVVEVVEIEAADVVAPLGSGVGVVPQQ